MFYNFQSLNLERLGANPVAIGGILGMVGAAMSVAHLPAGYLSDRFGRRPLLLSAWWLGSISTAVMALSQGLSTFVIGMVLYGLTAFVAGPLNAYAVSARGKLRTEQVVALIIAAFNGGSILGPLIGGWLGETWGLHAVFYAAFFLFVISTALVWQIKSQPVEVPEQTASRWSDLINRRFLGLLGVVFLGVFAMFVSQPLAANFLQNERGLSLSQIGFLISGRSVGIVVFSLAFGQRPARQGFLLGLLGITLFNALMWQGTNPGFYLAAYLLLGTYAAARSMVSVIASRMVRPENLGLAFGALETIQGIVAVGAPPLAGYLYSLNPYMVFPVGMLALLIVGAISFFALPRT